MRISNKLLFLKGFFLLLLLPFAPLQAQESAPDSLLKYNLQELEVNFQTSISRGDFKNALPIALTMLQKGQKELNTKDTAFAQILYKLADLYEYTGNAEKALDYLNQTVAIQKVKIPRHADYARSLHLFGILYRSLGDYEQSERYYKQALAIRKESLGEKHPRYAATLFNLGLLYSDKGDYTQAERFYKDALAIRKEVLGEKHPEYAASLSNLGILYFQLGDIKQAEALYLQTLSVQKEALGEKHPDYAATLNNLALLYQQSNKYALAEKYYQQALETQKKAWGEEHPDYAATLDNLGILYTAMGDYEKANTSYLRALSIRQKINGKNHLDCAKSFNNLGNFCAEIGDYEEAENYFLQALAIKKEVLGEKHSEYAASLSNLGILNYKIGNFEQAETFYQQALRIEKEHLGEEHPDYAATLNSLGILYHDTKEYQKSEKYYLQALEASKKVWGEDHPDYAKNLNDLAVLYQDMGKSKEAENYYLKVSTLYKKILGAEHPKYAQILNNLGSLYINLGNYEAAEPYYKEALSIFKNNLGESHPNYSAGLNNLSELYLLTNRTELAWQEVQAAMSSNVGQAVTVQPSKEWVEKLGKSEYLSFSNANNSLILIYKLLGKEQSEEARNKQILVADLALSLLQKHKNAISAEGDKLRILALRNDWAVKSVKIINKEQDAAKAFSIAEQNKSVLLLDAASHKRLHSFGLLPDSLIQVEKQLEIAYTELKAALVQKKTNTEKDSLQKELNNLALKTAAFENRIESQYPKYAALKYQHAPAKVTEIQALLDDKTALLEYLVGDSVVYVFYVDKKQVKIHELPIKNDVLKEKSKALHSTLSDYKKVLQESDLAYKEYTENAHWFYQNLVENPLKNAKAIKQLIIVPEAELGLLPFETFLVKAAPKEKTSYQKLHYLINDFGISYNYSASLWKENKSSTAKKKNNGKILGMAANYENKETNSLRTVTRLASDQRLREALSPLPAARAEVAGLAGKFSGFFGFDSLANEKTFKQKAGEYAIIHLAMHGLLKQKEPMLSSLAFTENNDSTENNFLHAYEITKLELNANLVVLSACETGLGRFEQGNGTASLARAFMYAGVPALVVSLWSVNDASTGFLMQIFYENLAKGMDKAEALRQAKLSYIKSVNTPSSEHPAFWSPFILLGDSSPVKIQTKGFSYWVWALAGVAGLAALAVIVGFIRRRKQS